MAEKKKRPAAKPAEASSDRPRDQYRYHRSKKTYEEWLQQPQAVGRTLERLSETVSSLVNKMDGQKPGRVVIIGCGDSYISGIGVQYGLETMLGVPCSVYDAFDFACFGTGTVDQHTVVLGLSSTGKTTAVRQGLTASRNQGAFTMAVTNTAGSPLSEEFDGTMVVPAVREGWPTQSSTGAMAAILLWAAVLSGQASYKEELQHLPGWLGEATQRCREPVKQWAHECTYDGILSFFGAGSHAAPAHFGAAKVKELCPVHALSLPLEEFFHYRSAKEGEPLFLTAPSGPAWKRALETAEVASYDGARVYAVVGDGNRDMESYAEHTLCLPEVPPWLAPVVYAVPMQLLAYELAMAKHEANVGYPPWKG